MQRGERVGGDPAGALEDRGPRPLALSVPDFPAPRAHVAIEEVCPTSRAPEARDLREELLRFVDLVVDYAAQRNGVSAKAVYSRSRLRPVVRARHEAWCVLRVGYGWSLPAIAFVFSVDHTTVLSATRAYSRARRVRVEDPPRVRVAEAPRVRYRVA